jgi:hypothetical protein
LDRTERNSNGEAGWKALFAMEIEVERGTSGENGDSKSEIRSTNLEIPDGEAGVDALTDRGEGESPDETVKGTEKTEQDAQPARDKAVVGLESLIGLALEILDGD